MKNEKIKSKIVLLFLVFLLSSAAAHQALAADLVLQVPNEALGVGDEFSVPIVLANNTDDVNAISGDMLFDDATLSAEKVLSANSIVSTWVEPPHISGNAVVFSGIMPGGYESVVDPTTKMHLPGIIATVIFRVKAEGTGTLEFTDAHLYKNDGLATEIALETPTATLSFAKQGSQLAVVNNDTNPPEAFTPVITQDPALYNGEFVVIFNTTDKETGIDHYEVKENGFDWVRAESPYLLQDQSLSGPVSVKAIDLAGNFRIGTVTPPPAFSTEFLVIILTVLIVVILLLAHYVSVRNRKENIKKI